jgi:hypothetical protein
VINLDVVQPPVRRSHAYTPSISTSPRCGKQRLHGVGTAPSAGREVDAQFGRGVLSDELEIRRQVNRAGRLGHRRPGPPRLAVAQPRTAAHDRALALAGDRRQRRVDAFGESPGARAAPLPSQLVITVCR